MRILIADNDGAMLEALQAFLWDHGHEAEIAGDALECMAILREFAPDVLALADGLHWGGADGVMELLEEYSRNSRLPIILLASGGSRAVSLPRLHAVLRKPVRLGQFLHLAESVGREARPSNRQGCSLSGGNPTTSRSINEPL